MLRVQIPLELIVNEHICPGGAVGVLAALSRRRSRVQVPSGALDRVVISLREMKPSRGARRRLVWHGTQTWYRDEAQTFVGVGSNPSRATEWIVGGESFRRRNAVRSRRK